MTGDGFEHPYRVVECPVCAETELIRLLVRAYGPHANMCVVQTMYQMLVPLSCDMVVITDCCGLSYWFWEVLLDMGKS